MKVSELKELIKGGKVVVTFWYNPDMPTTSGRTPQLEQPPIMPGAVSSEVNDFRERRFRLALEQVSQKVQLPATWICWWNRAALNARGKGQHDAICYHER